MIASHDDAKPTSEQADPAIWHVFVPKNAKHQVDLGILQRPISSICETHSTAERYLRMSNSS
jgi:hypothetical protein